MAGKSSGTKTFSFLGLAKLVHDAVGFSSKGLKRLVAVAAAAAAANDTITIAGICPPAEPANERIWH